MIPADELRVETSRSGGPGGQHVNTTDSRVRLRFALARSVALPDGVKERLAARYPSQVTDDGELVLTCDVHRSQHMNHEEARERLVGMIRDCWLPPKPRRATKPTRSSQERRVAAKGRRGEVKAGRRKVKGDD